MLMDHLKQMGRNKSYHLNAHSVDAYFSNNTHKQIKKLLIFYTFAEKRLRSAHFVTCLLCHCAHQSLKTAQLIVMTLQCIGKLDDNGGV